MKKLKLNIEGVGSLEEIIESLEVSLRMVKSLQNAKELLDEEDSTVSATWSDAISFNTITQTHARV